MESAALRLQVLRHTIGRVAVLLSATGNTDAVVRMQLVQSLCAIHHVRWAQMVALCVLSNSKNLESKLTGLVTTE